MSYDNIEQWIRRNRLLRPKRSGEQLHNKEQLFLYLYDLALDGREIPAKPYIYESHNADIRQIPHLDAIICDIHYFDISWLVSSSFYVDPTHDIKRLAHALIADSLLCHGNPVLALKYANKFASGPYVAAHIAALDSTIRDTVYSSVSLQIEFAMGHEISHYFCEDSSSNLAVLLKGLLSYCIDNHNNIAKQINSIDLSPIKEHLDRIDLLSGLVAPTSPETLKHVQMATIEMITIIEKYRQQIDMSSFDAPNRKKLLVYACDNYLHGVKAAILPKEQLVTEGVCDLLAFTDIMQTRFFGKTDTECRKLSIDAYVLSMLTLDMIQCAMNTQKYSNGDGYKYVDTVFMRREKERFIIPKIVDLYNWPDIDELVGHLEDVSSIADQMYAEFGEYVLCNNYSTANHVLMGSKDWQAYYYEINRLLQLPI